MPRYLNVLAFLLIVGFKAAAHAGAASIDVFGALGATGIDSVGVAGTDGGGGGSASASASRLHSLNAIGAQPVEQHDPNVVERDVGR